MRATEVNRLKSAPVTVTSQLLCTVSSGAFALSSWEVGALPVFGESPAVPEACVCPVESTFDGDPFEG